MKEISILAVDDEERMRELISLYLEKEGYRVETAADGQEALKKFKEKKFDLFILDIMMPRVDGWKVCTEIRRQSDIPIILLTARGEEQERVLGFELGADDYVVKPFSLKELTARVKALLKRTVLKDTEKTCLQFPRMTINSLTREVKIDGKDIILTPKEFDLLFYLASEPGRVFTREQILENVWGYDFYGDFRTIDAHIKKIREKINKVQGPDYVSTVWGVGYKFETD